jgi:hypothetical protein
MAPLLKIVDGSIVDLGMAWRSSGKGWKANFGSPESVHLQSGEALVMELAIDENDVAIFTVSRKEKNAP